MINNLKSLDLKYAKSILVKLLDNSEPVPLTELQKFIKNYYALKNTVKKLEEDGLVKTEEKILGHKVIFVTLTEMGQEIARIMVAMEETWDPDIKVRLEFIKGKDEFIKAKTKKIFKILESEQDDENLANCIYELAFFLASSPSCTLSNETKELLGDLAKELDKRYGGGSFEPSLLVYSILQDLEDYENKIKNKDKDEISNVEIKLRRLRALALNRYLLDENGK